MSDIEPHLILFEDSWLIALNKPSGRFTQAAYGVPNLQLDVQRYLQHRDGLHELPYVGIIHRLDRPTSGVLLFGRTVNSVRRMNEQFRERIPSKTYLAIVSGVPECNGSAIDWMRKIEDVARAELCSEDDHDAKQAVLHWKRLATDGANSLLEIQLDTGRMHQIRLQLASRGFPVFGDSLYTNKTESDSDSAPMLFGLHAAELTFRHPKSAKLMVLRAQVPSVWFEQVPWIRDVIE